MEEKTLYSDKLVEIRYSTILFHKYYFPTFSKKSVKFSEIDKIIVEKPTRINGKYRYWGTGDFLNWFPVDKQRNKRDVIFNLHRKNKRIRVGFTVENSEKVTKLIKEKTIIHFN